MTSPTSSTSRWVHPPVVSGRYSQAVRARRALRGLALVAVEVGALLLLLRIDLPSVDWTEPAAWLERVPPEDAVIALVRLAALATVGYLVLTTALYVVATFTRVPSLIRGVNFLTVPSVRRLVDGALAAALVAAPASLAFGTAPASAQAVPTSTREYVPVAAGDTDGGYTPTPAGGAPSTPASNYVVQPGDNLWTIASRHLATTRDVAEEEISDGDIADSWRVLVDLNASSLVSGNPDVIYAGETLRLPAN